MTTADEKMREEFSRWPDRDKFARLITGVDVLGGTQTAEAYKRIAQAEANKYVYLVIGALHGPNFIPYPPFPQGAVLVYERRMAAELKKEE